MPVFGRNYVCLEIVGNSVMFPEDILWHASCFFVSSRRGVGAAGILSFS